MWQLKNKLSTHEIAMSGTHQLGMKIPNGVFHLAIKKL
jgi:hypothetical protein